MKIIIKDKTYEVFDNNSYEGAICEAYNIDYIILSVSDPEIDIWDYEVEHNFQHLIGLPIISWQMIYWYKVWGRPLPKEAFDFVVPEGTYIDLLKAINNMVVYFEDFKDYQGQLHGDHRFLETLREEEVEGRKCLSVYFGS
jgi:hypothetical protein